MTLSWTNPPHSFWYVMVRRAEGAIPPSGPHEGTLVQETGGTSFTDPGLSPATQYSYSVFTVGADTYYSPAVTITASTATAGHLLQKLTPSGPANQFGVDVAMSGDTLAVANLSDPAYAYKANAAGGESAEAVATSGDRIVVGRPLQPDYSGLLKETVYLYQPNSSGGYASRKVGDGTAGFGLGEAVALEGNTIVAGEPLASPHGYASGKVRVYHPNGPFLFANTHTLEASDGAAGDFFGAAVAISGGTIVVGAQDHGVSGEGAVYVYTPNGAGGYDETKLTASDAAAGDGFGCALAISGGTIVVGAPGDDDGGSEAGAAYAYTADGTVGYDERKLIAPDAATGNDFGFSVATAGGVIAVGARDAGPGAVYLFAPILEP
jgi:hypothetical protein